MTIHGPGGDYPAGVACNILNAFELRESYAGGRLRGELAEIASTLTEDDNPVLMIATFKSLFGIFHRSHSGAILVPFFA